MQSDINGYSPQRRHCIALALTLAIVGLKPRQAVAGTKPTVPRILVLGDSMSAEYGLKRGTGWVSLLEARLVTEKLSAIVINASISGDTSSGGRARLPDLLSKHRPTVVLIELGGNDALRGLPLALTQDNLLSMVQMVKASGAAALVLGMQVPPNYGRSYAQQFTDMFADVARTGGARLVPFMLKGLADVPDSAKWFQADRIHPTQEAQPQILANIWPELKKGLK